MAALTVGLLALMPVQETATTGFWDRIEFYGNGRIRGESTFENVDSSGNAIENRHRGRLRLRAGAKYQLEENLKVEGRISTASDGNDANNPHWDFGDGDGFNGSEVVVDRFFIDWQAAEELNALAGKQPHAFSTPPIYGDFLWDSDVSPSGVAGTWRPKTEGDVTFDARAAGYVATEVAADDDATMLGAQGNAYFNVDETKVQVSTSLYDWSSTNVVAGNQGNTADADFLIWESFAAATIPGGPLDEMVGYLEVMSNLDEGDDDFGWVVGGQVGPSKWQQGAYNVFLLYYDLQADAVFSPVAQDDTAVAGTGIGSGMDGIVVGGTYFWRDHIAFKLWALTSHPDEADDDPIRIRLDLDFTVK